MIAQAKDRESVDDHSVRGYVVTWDSFQPVISHNAWAHGMSLPTSVPGTILLILMSELLASVGLE